MYRTLKTLVVLPWLAGCGMPAWNAAPAPDWAAQPLPAARYDFDWRLSGDRQVAPLQVFDNGSQTWLQFAPGQALPAIFADSGGVERPVPYTRREPYAVLDGKWPALVLRGGRLRARADYMGARDADVNAPAGVPADDAVAVSGPVPAVAASPLGHGIAHRPLTATANATAHTVAAATPARHSMAASTYDHKAQPTGATVASRTRVAYRAGPSDDNMRRVLTRWTQGSGWTFGPEHWAVDVDIPLNGSADFGLDFKQAVRDLMASTELADRPLQPCFYANRVLRVIPLSQACDRTAARAGATL